MSHSYKESFTFLNKKCCIITQRLTFLQRCHMVKSVVTFLNKDVSFLQRVCIFRCVSFLHRGIKF